MKVSKQELLAAILKGAAGMIPLVGSFAQEFVGLCLPRPLSDLEQIESLPDINIPVWLFMIQSQDVNGHPIFWQIASVARDEYEGRKLAEKLIHDQGCFPTKVDGSFMMQEEKALAHESFSKLYIAARVFGIAAIRMEDDKTSAA